MNWNQAGGDRSSLSTDSTGVDLGGGGGGAETPAVHSTPCGGSRIIWSEGRYPRGHLVEMRRAGRAASATFGDTSHPPGTRHGAPELRSGLTADSHVWSTLDGMSAPSGVGIIVRVHSPSSTPTDSPRRDNGNLPGLRLAVATCPDRCPATGAGLLPSSLADGQCNACHQPGYCTLNGPRASPESCPLPSLDILDRKQPETCGGRTNARLLAEHHAAVPRPVTFGPGRR